MGTSYLNPDNETQHIIFSAIQKEEVTRIAGLFEKLDINLVSIDSSYTSLIRGLAISDIAKQVINDGKLWCILLITANNFVIITLSGNKIIDIIEEPLATKSFSADDVYPVIVSYSLDVIKSKNPENLVIVSESNEVLAEQAAKYFNLSCKISVVESNKYAKKQLFNIHHDALIGANTLISPEVVGTRMLE